MYIRTRAHPTRNANAKAKRELASSKRANNAGCRRWLNKRVVSQITVRHVAHTDAMPHREMPNNAPPMHRRCTDGAAAPALKCATIGSARVAPQRYLPGWWMMRPTCRDSPCLFCCARRSRNNHGAISLSLSLSVSRFFPSFSLSAEDDA